MDEFNDSDISSLLNQLAGSSPDTKLAHQAVLGKVRRVRQRRVVTVGAAAVVMVVSGAVAMVQNSQNRDGGSNIAVPLSPDDSLSIAASSTIDPAVTTTIDSSISIDPIVTDPPNGTPSSVPSNNSSLPSNTSVSQTTQPTTSEEPSNTQVPSITTIPSKNSGVSTTIARSTTTVPNAPSTTVVKVPPTTTRPPATNPPTTPAPITSPPTTKAPVVTAPPTTQAPVTSPPANDVKTWSCGGGSVDYRVTSSGLVWVATRPATGFKISENKSKSEEISVKFIPLVGNDGRKSALKIKKSGLISTSCDDEKFNRGSDSSDSESTDKNDESADD